MVIAIPLRVAAFVLSAATACAPRPEIPRETPVDYIAIGAAGPMSGPYAAFGEQMRKGAQLAVQDINVGGGVLGMRLVLEIGDDRCDPRKAVAVANDFVLRGVVFVAGHFCSGASIPAAQVYEEEKIVMISPASTNPRLTEMGLDNVFRVSGRDDQQGVVAGNYMADNFANQVIAILHDGTAYGGGMASVAKEQLNRRGIKETIYQEYTAGTRDYSGLVSKLRTVGVDVIYIGGYHGDAARIIREAHEQDFHPQLLAGDALVTDEFWKIAGKAGDGTMMTFVPDPRSA